MMPVVPALPVVVDTVPVPMPAELTAKSAVAPAALRVIEPSVRLIAVALLRVPVKAEPPGLSVSPLKVWLFVTPVPLPLMLRVPPPSTRGLKALMIVDGAVVIGLKSSESVPPKTVVAPV